MKVEIKVIPHKKQRMDDCGDWQWKGSNLCIHVSNLKNQKYNSVLVIHELVEALLCRFRGITTKQVDDWDRNHEKMGDDHRAPYHKEHTTATFFEKRLAKLLNVDWDTYNNSVNSL